MDRRQKHYVTDNSVWRKLDCWSRLSKTKGLCELFERELYIQNRGLHEYVHNHMTY